MQVPCNQTAGGPSVLVRLQHSSPSNQHNLATRTALSMRCEEETDKSGDCVRRGGRCVLVCSVSSSPVLSVARLWAHQSTELPLSNAATVQMMSAVCPALSTSQAPSRTRVLRLGSTTLAKENGAAESWTAAHQPVCAVSVSRRSAAAGGVTAPGHPRTSPLQQSH